MTGVSYSIQIDKLAMHGSLSAQDTLFRHSSAASAGSSISSQNVPAITTLTIMCLTSILKKKRISMVEAEHAIRDHNKTTVPPHPIRWDLENS